MWTVGSPIASPDDILTHRQNLVVTPKGTTYTDSSLYVYEMGTQRLLGLRPKGTQQFLQNQKNVGLHVSPDSMRIGVLGMSHRRFQKVQAISSGISVVTNIKDADADAFRLSFENVFQKLTFAAPVI